jgi:hypothetical protein
MKRFAGPAFLLAGILAGSAEWGRAAEPPPPPGWYSTSGFSYVMAAGNSGTSTLGLKAEVKRLWPNATFSLGGSVVRAQANDPGRRAVGDARDFELESGPSVLKAAKYNAGAAYDRNVSDRLGWQAGVEFDRDRFSGLKGRSLALAGVRYLLANRKDLVLKAGLAATLAHQSEVVDDPLTRNTFVGARLGLDAEKTLGANSKYVGGLAIDENLQDTDDLRVRFANALAVSMNKRLALQVGILMLYDHQPSLLELPLFDRQGTPTGLSVAAEAATLDTTFTVSVVVSFAPRTATP